MASTTRKASPGIRFRRCVRGRRGGADLPRPARGSAPAGRRAGLHGHVPDGLAFTTDRGCLISNYRPDRIYTSTPTDASTWWRRPAWNLIAAPTNGCFVGERLDRVVSANLGRWHPTLLDLGLVGAPLHCPERCAVDSL